MERAAYPIPEAAFQLGVSRSHAYRMIAAGELRAIKLGRRTLIPASEIRRVAEQAEAA